MQEKTLSLDKCFLLGWEAFKANPIPAIVGVLIYTVIAAVGQNIPFLCYLFMAFVTGPFVGGVQILMLNLANRNNPQITDVFQGFKRYWDFMGVYWLFTAGFLACSIPIVGILAIIGALLDKATSSDFIMFLFIIAGILISLTIWTIVAIRWIFAGLIVADNWHDNSVITAFKKSNRMTLGRRWEIFWKMLVFALAGGVGALACLLGILVTAPISGCGFISLYNDLKAKYSN